MNRGWLGWHAKFVMQNIDNFQDFLESQEDLNHYCIQVKKIK